MSATQQEIAKLAKVSQSTVSRVIAGDDRVEPALRDRVLAAMERHNYFADSRGRSLRSRKSGLIGLVLKRQADALLDDPFVSTLVSAITEYLRGTSYHFCMDIAHDAEEQSRIYEELLRTRRVDGLIVVEPEANDYRLAQLQRDSFPFVVIGNPGRVRASSVDNDNVLAGRMATLHLLDAGFHNVGFLAGPDGVHVSDDRLVGYSFAMRERDGIEMVWHSEFGLKAAEKVALEIFSNPVRPRALVVLDDFMALGVAMAAIRMGMKIPQDLALVSFNDSSFCQAIEGGLSSVNLNFQAIILQACNLLFNIIDNPEAEVVRQIIPCELSMRGSSVNPLGGVL